MLHCVRWSVPIGLVLFACSNDAPSPSTPNDKDSGGTTEDAPPPQEDAPPTVDAPPPGVDVEWKSDAPRTLPDGAYAPPCDSRTGLRPVRADLGASSASPSDIMTGYIIDFDLRRAIATFPMLYDATEGWIGNVNPGAIPGQPACQELERYGIVVIAKSTISSSYTQAGTARDMLGLGGGAPNYPNGCTAFIQFAGQGASIIEFYAWDIRGTVLSDPVPMTPPETSSIYTLTDMVPLCQQSVPDTVHISVARNPGKVVKMRVTGRFRNQ